MMLHALMETLGDDVPTSLTRQGKRGPAVFSPCERMRYALGRRVELDPDRRGVSRGRLVWILLNPSTADQDVDDPTIRRCLGFAQAWGYTEVAITNVYPFRATDPKDMKRALKTGVIDAGHRAINLAWIRALAAVATTTIAAWGANARPEDALAVRAAIADQGKLLHRLNLPLTKSGQPPHPLYQLAITQIAFWPFDPKGQS